MRNSMATGDVLMAAAGGDGDTKYHREGKGVREITVQKWTQ